VLEMPDGGGFSRQQKKKDIKVICRARRTICSPKRYKRQRLKTVLSGLDVCSVTVDWQKEMAATYNSGYSLVVTHLTTNPPVRCLNRAERTGSLVFNVLWSYVEEVIK
jgi:hypothetical protein